MGMIVSLVEAALVIQVVTCNLVIATTALLATNPLYVREVV